MNETNPTFTELSRAKPIEAKTNSVMPNFLSKISEKIPQKVKDIFKKFYAKKMIFWPITISFGLIFLIIILGLLFGSKKAPTIIPPKKTPPPFVLSTPLASPSGDILSVIENQLIDLNNQINSLDIGQNKLKPPTIDYNINF